MVLAGADPSSRDSDDGIGSLKNLPLFRRPQSRISQAPYAQLSFATTGRQLLVSAFEFNRGASYERTSFSLTVPGLEWHALTQSDWDSAVRAHTDVRDDNYVYFSSVAPDSSDTSITRQQIKTGKIEILYREPVPRELRPKSSDRPSER